MRMRRMLAVASCAVAVVALGAGSAFAGEITGNGKWTPSRLVRTRSLHGKSDLLLLRARTTELTAWVSRVPDAGRVHPDADPGARSARHANGCSWAESHWHTGVHPRLPGGEPKAKIEHEAAPTETRRGSTSTTRGDARIARRRLPDGTERLGTERALDRRKLLCSNRCANDWGVGYRLLP